LRLWVSVATTAVICGLLVFGGRAILAERADGAGAGELTGDIAGLSEPAPDPGALSGGWPDIFFDNAGGSR
jgi:hypothetical protein